MITGGQRPQSQNLPQSLLSECQGLNAFVSQLCRRTLGQTVWTEMGHDNGSSGILLRSSLSLHAALVGQRSPLEVMSLCDSSDPEKLREITTQ